jgi:hypothetical protein
MPIFACLCFRVEDDGKKLKKLLEEEREVGEATKPSKVWLWIGAKPDTNLGQDSI